MQANGDQQAFGIAPPFEESVAIIAPTGELCGGIGFGRPNLTFGRGVERLAQRTDFADFADWWCFGSA